MDIYTILGTIWKYSLVALMGIGALIPLYAGAFLIYKHVFHGKKRLRLMQWCALVLLSGWLLLVLGLTTFSRGANFSGNINLSLFSSYVNAWHEWSYRELQLIIFNMLMFAPLGFLLPLLTKRGERFGFACLISFLVTAFIEVLQLITGKGIFELDDLLHNFMGSLFGYWIMMFILTCVRERRFKLKPFLSMMILPALFGIGIGGAVLAYNHQEYGNMPIVPAQRQDMSAISLENRASLSGDAARACIYKNPRANNAAYVDGIARAVEDLTGIRFKSSVYREGSNAIYVSDSSDAQLTVFTDSGEWSYTAWPEELEKLSQAEAMAKCQEMEVLFKEYGLLPDGTTFTVQNGTTLRWNAPSFEQEYPERDFVSGGIMLEYSPGGDIANIHFFIIPNEYVKSVDIISEEAAYNSIAEGNFEQYPPFEKGDSVTVEDCELSYEYDTKGFLRPIYRFTGYINGADYIWEGKVSAMQ